MRKTAAAAGLAALAAAGASLVAADSARTATARGVRLTEARCTPGGDEAAAVKGTDTLKVASRTVGDKLRVNRGAWVRTDADGSGLVCLREGNVECHLGPETLLQVLPPKTGVLLRLSRSHGGVTCKAEGNKRKRIEARGEKITFGELGLTASARTWSGHGSGSAKPAGNLLSVFVRGNRTLVKVRRGATLVEAARGRATAVVLGKEEQVAVAADQDPQRPRRIELSAAERRIFGQLARLLPRDTDRTPPRITLKGPPTTSSVRFARFDFTASEARTTFSCGFDGVDLHLCTTPQAFEGLKPGTHTFTVKATDAAGNIRIVRYTWRVDGSRIAFVSNRDGNAEIYVMDPDGTNQRRLTENAANDLAPEWSPDRTRIAFHSDRDGNDEIYVMNADGSGLTRLTSHAASDRNPTWSPDGTRLAFQSTRDGNSEIYVTNVDGAGPRRLTTTPGEDQDPSWSPDGTRIAFASARDANLDINVMNADGSRQTRLTTDPAAEFNPAWSPDSKRLAFHSDRSGRSWDIYAMNADGSDVERLTESDNNDYNPAWAPDGRHLVFQSDRRDNQTDVYLMNSDGSAEERLTRDQGDDVVPDW